MDLPSPSDLAVVFRSFSRRLADIDGSAETPQQVAAARQTRRRVATAIAAAVRALKVTPSGDADRDAEVVADRIDAIAPADWDDDTLGRLQTIVADVTKSVRAAERATD